LLTVTSVIDMQPPLLKPNVQAVFLIGKEEKRNYNKGESKNGAQSPKCSNKHGALRTCPMLLC
jgi:hypothetical protein